MPSVSGGKFVIVGGASLLGSHIGEQLLEGGAREVVLFDNLSLGSADNIEALLADPRCRFVRGDVLRLNELSDPFEGADGVFAVAGFLAKPMAANPWLGLDVNVRGMQNVMEAARVQGVSKVVFSSSVGVYGGPDGSPCGEDSPLRWQGMSPAVILYCTSKIMGEGLGFLYAQNHGVDFIALRYSALYGERLHRRALDATRMLEAWESLREGKRPVIEGDGTQVQDYIYIGDVARANLMAMESAASGEGINIASGEDTSLKDVVRLVTEACGSDAQPEFRSTGAMGMPKTARMAYTRDRARDLIGWEPQVPLAEGIRRMVAWADGERARGA